MEVAVEAPAATRSVTEASAVAQVDIYPAGVPEDRTVWLPGSANAWPQKQPIVKATAVAAVSFRAMAVAEVSSRAMAAAGASSPAMAAAAEPYGLSERLSTVPRAVQAVAAVAVTMVVGKLHAAR